MNSFDDASVGGLDPDVARDLMRVVAGAVTSMVAREPWLLTASDTLQDRTMAHASALLAGWKPIAAERKTEGSPAWPIRLVAESVVDVLKYAASGDKLSPAEIIALGDAVADAVLSAIRKVSAD